MNRLGALSYINALPVNLGWNQNPASANTRTVYATPRRLNEMLAQGELDLSPVSSIEFARHQDQYLLAGNLCLLARREVGSVLLFSRVSLQELGGQVLAVTKASATAVALTRIVLDLMGVTPATLLEVNPAPPDELLAAYPAALLIGDDALLARRTPTHPFFDLGRLWADLTGEAMVYALWVVRRPENTLRESQLQNLIRGLMQARDFGRQALDQVVQEAGKKINLPAAELRQYYQALEFTLDAAGRRGLLRFYELAARLGLCPACTDLPSLDPGQ